MTNRGMTLVELLVCLAIIGILAPYMGKLFLNLNRIIIKAEQAQSQISSIKFAPTNTCATGTVVVCFDNGKALGCDDQHPCFCQNNQWKRNNGLCSDGVLLK